QLDFRAKRNERRHGVTDRRAVRDIPAQCAGVTDRRRGKTERLLSKLRMLLHNSSPRRGERHASADTQAIACMSYFLKLGNRADMHDGRQIAQMFRRPQTYIRPTSEYQGVRRLFQC